MYVEDKQTNTATGYFETGYDTPLKHLTFRSSRIIYYGPHACGNCGVTICKMGHEWGGNAFTYPQGPVYPNTEWHPHVCDPKMVERYSGVIGRAPLCPPDAPPRQRAGQ